MDYFASGPIVAMVWEGPDVILTGRKMLGATNPNASEPGERALEMFTPFHVCLVPTSLGNKVPGKRRRSVVQLSPVRLFSLDSKGQWSAFWA